MYSVNYCDRLGRCFRFVCIYACTAVFLCCYRFSVNKIHIFGEVTDNRGALFSGTGYDAARPVMPGLHDTADCTFNSTAVLTIGCIAYKQQL